jgi:hypothetical protein
MPVGTPGAKVRDLSTVTLTRTVYSVMKNHASQYNALNMENLININISGIIFHIEEDGYEILNKYLESMQKIAATYNAPSAIMANIENRIADTFLSKLKDGLPVVTEEDVEDLIERKEGFKQFKTIKYTNHFYLL